MRYKTDAEIAEDNANVEKKCMAIARDKLVEQFALAYVGRFGLFNHSVASIVERSRALVSRLQEANEGPDQ